MSGHSQFKNIMHRKGAQDQMRAKVFSKLAKEITVAAKMGLPDPASNPRLRSAILAARAENMPKDNIERAIKKGSPGEDSTVYDEVRYEGYGPGNVAVIVEALTDNRTRTAPNLRSAFSKKGGNMGESGSVAFNFERVGLIEYPVTVADNDAMFEAVIEAGANDVESDEETHTIYCNPDDLFTVRAELEKKFGDPTICRLDWKVLVSTPITDLETAEKLMNFISGIEEDDDVQRVITNADIAPEILEKLNN